MPLIWLVYTYWPDNLLRIGSIAPAVSGFMAVYTLIYVVISIRRERGEGDGRQRDYEW